MKDTKVEANGSCLFRASFSGLAAEAIIFWRSGHERGGSVAWNGCHEIWFIARCSDHQQPAVTKHVKLNVDPTPSVRKRTLRPVGTRWHGLVLSTSKSIFDLHWTGSRFCDLPTSFNSNMSRSYTCMLFLACRLLHCQLAGWCPSQPVITVQYSVWPKAPILKHVEREQSFCLLDIFYSYSEVQYYILYICEVLRNNTVHPHNILYCTYMYILEGRTVIFSPESTVHPSLPSHLSHIQYFLRQPPQKHNLKMLKRNSMNASLLDAFGSARVMVGDAVSRRRRSSFVPPPPSGSVGKSPRPRRSSTMSVENCAAARAPPSRRNSFLSLPTGSNNSLLSVSMSGSISAHHRSPSPSRNSTRRSVTSNEKFQRIIEDMAVTEEAMRDFLNQEGGLQSIKQSLKDCGVVTNSSILQGIHFVVRDCKLPSVDRIWGGRKEAVFRTIPLFTSRRWSERVLLRYLHS